jgi:hypothetical protein
MDYVYEQWDAYDVIVHGRANLDSRRTPVERQILSVPVNDKPLLRMVNVKWIGYESKQSVHMKQG